MAINLMCTNSKCKFYWEDNCVRNLNEERIEINEYGLCETFEVGVSELYSAEEECNKNETHEEVYAELAVINCDTCKNNPKYNNGYAPAHTCDICISLDQEDFEMWEHR